MSNNTTCNLCRHPGTYDGAIEKGRVNCHVRRFSHEGFTVWRCTSCNSLHSLESVELYNYYKHYPLQSHTLNWSTRLAYRTLLRRFQRAGLKPHHRFLDYGCNQGLLVHYLKEQGYQQAFGYDAFVERFKHPELLDQEYDFINCQDVIEHVDEPHELLAQLRGLLKIGGAVLIGSPDAARISLERQEDFGFELSQPYHRHIFSRTALIEAGARHGFRCMRAYDRFYYDTLVPAVNTRFIWDYLKYHNNIIDPLFEEPRYSDILRSPRLLFSSWFGYFFSPRRNMAVEFT